MEGNKPDDRPKPPPKPAFDADFGPDHPANKEAAAARRLRYDRTRQCYADDDGCMIRDRFGQPY